MAAAKITPDISIQTMRRIILRTIAVSGLRDAQVRYYSGAGPGGFALSHDECVEPTFYVMVSRLSFFSIWAISLTRVFCSQVINGRAAPDPSKGVSVVTSAVPIKPASFATVKSVNYLPNAMVVADAHERGADYGVWITERGEFPICISVFP
jgi:4-amino-4-deoxychorismate lyase